MLSLDDLTPTTYRDLVARISLRFVFTRQSVGARTLRKAAVYSYVGSGKSALIAPLKTSMQQLLMSYPDMIPAGLGSTKNKTRPSPVIGHGTVDANVYTQFSQAGIDFVDSSNQHFKTKPDFWTKMVAFLEAHPSGLYILHIDEYNAQEITTLAGWLNFEQGGRMGPHELTDEQCARVVILTTGNGPKQGGAQHINSLAAADRGSSYLLQPSINEVADYVAARGLLPAPIAAWVRMSSKPILSHYLHGTTDGTGPMIVNSFTPRSFEDVCVSLTNIPGALSKDGLSITHLGESIMYDRWPQHVVNNVLASKVLSQALTPWRDIVDDPENADIPDDLLAQHVQASVLFGGISNQVTDVRFIPAMIVYLSRPEFDSDVVSTCRYVIGNVLTVNSSNVSGEILGMSTDDAILDLCRQFVSVSMNSHLLVDTEDGIKPYNDGTIAVDAAMLYHSLPKPDDADNDTDDLDFTDDTTQENVTLDEFSLDDDSGDGAIDDSDSDDSDSDDDDDDDEFGLGGDDPLSDGFFDDIDLGDAL